MDKITYLLGAGASIEALPLAKDLAKCLLEFAEKGLSSAIEKLYGTSGSPLPEEYTVWPKGSFAKDLVESFRWLGEEAGRHLSVDTYAKKLFIRNDETSRQSLHKLKVTLSCYLLLQQSLKSVDKRYDGFLASILNPSPDGRPCWPEAVNIVTWNYDTQLEKSYKEFCRDQQFVHEGITASQNIKRLNGLCGAPNNKDMRDLGYLSFNRSYFELVQNLFEGQMNGSQAVTPSISFAWEKEEGLENDAIKMVRHQDTYYHRLLISVLQQDCRRGLVAVHG